MSRALALLATVLLLAAGAAVASQPAPAFVMGDGHAPCDPIRHMAC